MIQAASPALPTALLILGALHPSPAAAEQLFLKKIFLRLYVRALDICSESK